MSLVKRPRIIFHASSPAVHLPFPVVLFPFGVCHEDVVLPVSGVLVSSVGLERRLGCVLSLLGYTSLIVFTARCPFFCFRLFPPCGRGGALFFRLCSFGFSNSLDFFFLMCGMSINRGSFLCLLCCLLALFFSLHMVYAVPFVGSLTRVSFVCINTFPPFSKWDCILFLLSYVLILLLFSPGFPVRSPLLVFSELGRPDWAFWRRWCQKFWPLLGPWYPEVLGGELAFAYFFGVALGKVVSFGSDVGLSWPFFSEYFRPVS